jgi:F-type H+-transporting ATPase subunit b
MGRLNESARLLAAARVEADAIISRTRTDAARAGDELKQKARADAENIVRNAEREIALETSRALQKVRQEAVDISVAIASKIIQRNLSKEDNERLIAETLKEIQTTRPN